MRKAFKYRIYLTNGQRRLLNLMLEECRWVYNRTLATRRDAYEQGVSLSWYETKAMLPGWKESRPSLKLAHSQVLQNVTQRVDLAFQAPPDKLDARLATEMLRNQDRSVVRSNRRLWQEALIAIAGARKQMDLLWLESLVAAFRVNPGRFIENVLAHSR